MTTPKNEEEILREWEQHIPHMAAEKPEDQASMDMARSVLIRLQREDLRSALASYLMHLKVEIPWRKDESYRPWSEPKDPVEDLSGVENELRSRRAAAFNAAVDQVHTLLDEKIRKLTV